MFSPAWIGATEGRAYLEVREANLLLQLHTVVYWTELADLSPETVSKITSGVNPWRVRRTAEGTGR